MADSNHPMAAFYTACWKDKDLRKQFMNDPKSILQAHGVALPGIIDVSAVEDCMHAPNCVHITLDGGACFCVRADPCADC